MLVLTRKTDQSILIGDEIEIRVVQIKGSGAGAQVRLGIVAPRGLTVLRKEIHDAVREENRRAARQAAAPLDPEKLGRVFGRPVARFAQPEGAGGPASDGEGGEG